MFLNPCSARLTSIPEKMRQPAETVRASVRHDQGRMGAPTSDEDATRGRYRDGAARARLTIHARHEHRWASTGPVGDAA